MKSICSNVDENGVDRVKENNPGAGRLLVESKRDLIEVGSPVVTPEAG